MPHQSLIGPAEMSADEFALLASAPAARRLLFKSREFVFLEDDQLNDIYVVESGSVRLANYSASGRERTIFLLGPHQMFGELNFCLGMDALTVAQAVVPTKIVRISRASFATLLEGHPYLYRVLAASLAHKMSQLYEQTWLATFGRVRERLIAGLLAITVNDTVDGQQDRATEVTVTQQELANLIGVHRVTVSRMLQDFEREGLVTLTRGHIRVFRHRVAIASSPD